MDRTGWMVVGAIAIGSAFGGVLRHLLTEAVSRLAGSGFPAGTVLVNLSGSFAIGLLVGLAPLMSWSVPSRHAAITGFLGGFTTFSAFSVQTVTLLQQGQTAAAATNVLVSVLGGVAACWAGFSWAVAATR